jgi:phage-related baseplate assembly protein
MSQFTAIDLSQLPKPQVVETLSFEAVLADLLADYTGRYPAFDAPVESEPVYKLLEVAAYRELILRQRVNDASHANMLAYAQGNDLDNLAANFPDAGAPMGRVTRLVIDTGNPAALPPVPLTLESDEALRRRCILAPEAYSTAGSEGAYIFHALSTNGVVKDAAADSPLDGDGNPTGEVFLTVLSRTGSGVPSGPLLAAVASKLTAKKVRPLTDKVTVLAASIINYTINATIYIYDGPDQSVVLAQAQANAAALVASLHRLGQVVALSAIYKALHVDGVERVVLTTPTGTVNCTNRQAPYCTAIAIVAG